MKKALAILLALALVAGAVFAEEPAYTLTGSASLTWGINLNDNTHGFVNASTASMSFPLGATSGSKGEEAITGQISISEFKVGIKNGVLTNTNGSVTAKILFPSNLYMTIASKPTFKVANAAGLDAFYADAGSSVDNVSAEIPSTDGGGFTFGMSGDLNFAVKFGSTKAYTANKDAGVTLTAEELATYSYMAGLNFGTKLGDMGSLAVNAILGSFDLEEMTIAAGLVLKLTPMDGLYANIAADWVQADDLNLDASLMAGYEMADLFGLDFGAYFSMVGEADELDMMARLNLLAVENLTFGAGVDLWDLTANTETSEILIAGNLGYKAALEGDNHISPYAKAAYSLLSEGLYVKVGANMMFFPLTTFTVDYTAGAPVNDNVSLDPILGSEAGTDKGLLTFKVAIAY